jgi:hypothetical protein
MQHMGSESQWTHVRFIVLTAETPDLIHDKMK